eukprot:scaffold93305_cov26-Tisochrysis_lutea.AAC.1
MQGTLATALNNATESSGQTGNLSVRRRGGMRRRGRQEWMVYGGACFSSSNAALEAVSLPAVYAAVYASNTPLMQDARK